MTPSSLAPRPERPPPAWLAYAPTAFALVLFFLTRSRLVIGDAATYGATILSGHLLERSIHLGYYVLGAGAARVFGLFGVPLDDALVLLDALCMAAAIELSRRLLIVLGAPPRRALLASWVLLFSGNVLMQGTIAEIYAPQQLLIVGSHLAFMRGRWAWAGVLHGVSMTLSPTSLFATGLFAWRAWRRRSWGGLAVTAAISAALFGGMLALTWQEYLYGTRGFLTAGSEQPYGVDTVLYQLYALAKNFHWMLPFMLAGVTLWWRGRNPLAWLLAVSAAFHLPAITGTRVDGVFLLALYPLFALAAAEGLEWAAGLLAPRLGRAALATALVAYAVCGAYVWLETPGTNTRRFVLDTLHRDYPEGAVLVAGWDYAEAVRFYGNLSGHELGAALVDADLMDPEAIGTKLGGASERYVIEHHYPRRLARLLMPPRALEARERRFSMLARTSDIVGAFDPVLLARVPHGPALYRLGPPSI